MPEKGKLKIQCFKGEDYIPLDGCKAIITPVGRSSKKRSREVEIQTDSSGLTELIELDAPPRKNTETPNGKVPYSQYNIKIQRDGFTDFIVNGCQIYSGEVAYQRCNLNPIKTSQSPEIITVLDNRLYGNYPNKIPEAEMKKLPPPSSGVVLPKPVVPEYIVVHNGTPTAQGANYKLLYKDYIKNVASSEIFSTYIKRIGRKQPLLTQYCNGTTVKCPDWFSQWGSKYLGDQGKTPFEILKYYYGNNIQLTTAEKVKGSPKSYPGYSLNIGASGEPVRTVQQFLNRIAVNYPLIPKVPVDGSYGAKVANQVKVFQGVFGLPVTGIVDYKTWYKISEIYVGVTKIAELNG